MSHWSTQQLAEFLAAVSSSTDEESAIRLGIERAAEALEAEVGALVRDGELVIAVGFPAGHVPDQELTQAAAGTRHSIEIPGAGTAPALVVPLEDDESGHLLVARSGEQPFSREEASLLRAMARVLTLTLRMLRTLLAERALLESLRRRSRFLEAISGIQHAISHRSPLTEVLGAITRGAEELLRSEVVGLLLVDPDDKDSLVMMSSQGVPPELLEYMRRRRVGEGAAGRAFSEKRLVVIEDYKRSEEAMAGFAAAELQVAMAAPVHEQGEVIGSLVVASYDADRRYPEEDRDMLRSFAEHASLALNDAKTADAMIHQALHDSLTGLPNRALFLDRLEQAITRGAAIGSAGATVLFLDLDRFKNINDSLGHAAGDELLSAVGERLRGCLRAPDTAARLGGDEFAVLLDTVQSPADGIEVAERIIQALRSPFELHGREVFVSTSIGVAAGREDAAVLLRNADIAMYRAKQHGMGRYEMFDPDMGGGFLERLDLEGDLQRAVERDELVLHYQPIVDLQSGELEGFEALVRWQHPERGLVPPLEFIPLAEETGLIFPIGRWVVEEACRQAARWHEQHPALGRLAMSVNLSARQLEHPAVVEDIATAIGKARIDPETLILEITETFLMQDTDVAIARLEQLKRLGVRLAIDDFGTGYSSLRYLRRFPIDILKMDKAFVDSLGQGASGSALARAIVDIGESFGMRVVAEGIEYDEQRVLLRELGCDLGQGYHFARPLDWRQASILLRDAAAGARFAAADAGAAALGA